MSAGPGGLEQAIQASRCGERPLHALVNATVSTPTAAARRQVALT
jgi:hypothetical protein